MDIKDEDIDQYLENEQKAMMVAMGGKSARGDNPLVPYTHQMLTNTNYNFSLQQKTPGLPM